jgi:hypothetical protein
MIRRNLLAVGMISSICAGFLVTASAGNLPKTTGDRPFPEAKQQAREKFAKLLLPDGPQKPSEKASKRKSGVVNAFGGGTKVIIGPGR